MKRTTFLAFFLLKGLAVCFPQKQIIQDQFSGLIMELKADKQFLTIIHIETGSPADLAPLRNGDRIFTINSKKVSDINDCMEYFRNNRDNSIQYGIRRFDDGDHTVTLERASVDLFSDNIFTEAELFSITYPFQRASISKDISTEKEKYEKLEEIVQSSHNPKAYSVNSLSESVKSCHYNIKLNSRENNQVSLLADGSKNLLDFKTFDFDYLAEDEPLLEKNLLNKLEEQLVRLGLERNTENPDMLIIISFYSGQQEQYVPPQQIISTKIHSYFNWYWGYIPVPVTESRTKEGYTKITYLTNITLKMLDAKEIPTSKVPPVLWSASYSELSSEKTFISDIAGKIFNSLLLQFPVVVKENSKYLSECVYTYTGIVYDKNNPAVIADVFPGSPASKAGIVKGDEIIRISDRKMPEEISSFIFWNNRSDYRNALKYLFMHTPLKNSDTGLFNPLKSDYKDYMSPEGQPVIFEIRKKGEISVVPEIKNAVFFENAGFTD